MSDDEEPIRLEWSEVPGTGEPPGPRLPRVGLRFNDPTGGGAANFLAESMSESGKREWRTIGRWALAVAAAIATVLGARWLGLIAS